MKDRTEITVDQVAEMLLTSEEVLHIADLGGRLLWYGKRTEYQLGKNIDEDSPERFRNLQVRHIGTTYNVVYDCAAVLLVVNDLYIEKQ